MFVDPNGDDWYKNNSYDPDKEGSQQYEWFEGSDTREGYTHLGEYLVTADKKSNTLSFRYQQEAAETMALNSDVGHMFRMVAAESNWFRVDQNGNVKNDGSGQIVRTPEFDLLVIAASLENRKRVDAYPDTYEGVASQRRKNKRGENVGYEYDGAQSSAYRNLTGQLSNWNKWYGEGEVMQYLASVRNATDTQFGPVFKLQTVYGLADAHKILGYSHNSFSKIYGSATIFITPNQEFLPPMLGELKRSYLRSIVSSRYVFPD